MKNITVDSLREIGIEKIAKFAGSINANYILYVNGGAQGYTYADLMKIKKTQEKYVHENFEDFIKAVVKRLNSEAVTVTEKYLKVEYKKWYSIK